MGIFEQGAAQEGSFPQFFSRNSFNILLILFQMLYLLSRCGTRLVELTLRSRFVLPVLQQVLESCPNVKHLRLWSMQLNAHAVDCIRKTLGRNLKSLAFENCLSVSL